MSPSTLIMLDGKDVDEKQRVFLQNLAVHKSKLGRSAPLRRKAAVADDGLEGGQSSRPMAQEPAPGESRAFPHRGARFQSAQNPPQGDEVGASVGALGL